MIRITLTAGIALALATAVLAHDGVKNPAVMARMEGMGTIRDATKVLGEMAKGARAFDADVAASAQKTLMRASARVAEQFADPETDPKSEALPLIWQNFADFQAKADGLEQAVGRMDVRTLEGLRAGMGDLGGACGACHKLYRE